jgi:hypothetical protein
MVDRGSRATGLLQAAPPGGVEWIDGQVMIPELLRTAPQVRPVLDRYGLRGCGGPLGPAESLAFFAHAHEVPLPALLEELRDAARETKPIPLPVVEEAADHIYRPFFKAGIAVTLTLGAVWGAYLLLRIAFGGKFTSVGIHEVNAHGHAQIFGWVGLFVMGFAYQAFPRFKHTSLAWPRLAYASLGLMLAGLITRCVMEPFAAGHTVLSALAVTASGLEVLAIVLFAAVVLATWRASGKGLAFYDYYILSALAWFIAQAVYETVYLAANLSAGDRRELLGLVATWQGPLRDIQIHGFALLMILGVSQRLFHHFYGLPAPNPRLSLVVLIGLNLAIIGESAGLVLLHRIGAAGAGLWVFSVLLLASCIVALLRDWRIFSPCPEADRSLKFLRAAYVWLLVSLGMLLLLPVYQHGLLPWLAPDSEAVRIGFSHAYSGAIRHAVTVGFISLMIVGVASRVVPTLNGVDVRSLSGLWAPFLLLNAGCALRVTAQTLTDFSPTAYPFTGASGLLEVLGLSLWGAHLWRIMSGRALEQAPSSGEAELPALLSDEPIAARHWVSDVLDHYPALLNTFVSLGFSPLANPFLRRTLARQVTVEKACRLLGVEVSKVLVVLNQAREQITTSSRAAGADACCGSCSVHDHEHPC